MEKKVYVIIERRQERVWHLEFVCLDKAKADREAERLTKLHAPSAWFEVDEVDLLE